MSTLITAHPEWVYPTDKSACEASIATFADGLLRHIEKWYGERCPDHCETCIPCQMWAAYDLLTDNPFAGDAELKASDE